MATAIAAASRALPLPPAFPAAPAIRAGWALFDPLVLTGEVDADTAAACATSDGHDVRVSLRLADPPAASYVLMRPDAELYRYNAPSVVAADGGLLLIHAMSSQEHNFVVYEAHPVSPLLRLLPHGHDLGFTGIVVSFGNLMCFVDYHRGILLCDVFAASPELRFLPLPEIEVWDDAHDYCNGRGLPEAYRTADVSQGVMKFVDVSDGLFGRRRSPFGVCITMWTLRTAPELGCWEKDAVLRLDDLWSFHEFRRSPMPRWVPQLPAVCKHDPDVVQFALLDPEFTPDNAWVTMVDMRQMELQGYAPYKN
ncbi:hypothetical protein BAE44_0000693 [Dichanthelium oligosanthes]|uniref:DUF1618 domain-containing protein n=1 Tax=Dichanthelium oligosanthes TaxID=888268 RepID=A0A1E5WLP3_9POAL|nr:hypothetical protein BAE44_0000693 [Dichanthelium oligosanthes]